MKESSKAARYLQEEKIPYDAVPELIAMGLAAGELLEYMDGMCTEMARLRLHFEDLLQKEIEELKIAGKKVLRVPNTTAFSIPGIHPELFLFHLAERGIFATCDKQLVSCTFSYQTTVEEIEKSGKEIIHIAKELKKLHVEAYG